MCEHFSVVLCYGDSRQYQMQALSMTHVYLFLFSNFKVDFRLKFTNFQDPWEPRDTVSYDVCVTSVSSVGVL